MRADWTASGACTSGSTAHPRGATRRACGGAGTTSTTSADADARTDVARRRGVVPRHVDRDDGGDDAAVVGPNGRPGETRLGTLTPLVGVGYFFVWTVFGMAAFPLGVALARAVPIAVGVVVLIAGFLQLTAWKARHLAYCREAPGRGRTLPADAGTAWRHGLRLGLHCSHCCAGLMAILLVIGVMDLRAMAVVAAAIHVERLAPAGQRVPRATGAVVIGAGLFLIARA